MPRRDRLDRLVAGLPRSALIDSIAQELSVAASTLAPTCAVQAERIGLVADTHCVTNDGSDLPDGVLRALAGSDVILHCGDLVTAGVLDRLATIAPVLCVAGALDPPADGERIHAGPLLVRAGATLIGLTTAFPDSIKPAELFGTDVDIVVSGTTHIPHVGHAANTLLVNPGSPTIPLSAAGPTVATIRLDAHAPVVHIVHLERIGAE